MQLGSIEAPILTVWFHTCLIVLSSEKRSVRDFYEDEAVIHDQTAPCIFVFLAMSVMGACFGARKVDGFFSRKTSSRNIKYK